MNTNAKLPKPQSPMKHFPNLEAVGMALAGAGVQISPARVPFTYHHDAIRNELQTPNTLSRLDVANRLQSIYPTPEQQTPPLLCGMFVQLLREQPAAVMRALSQDPQLMDTFIEITPFRWDFHVQKMVGNG
jgi:hypothetical protein